MDSTVLSRNSVQMPFFWNVVMNNLGSIKTEYSR
jgi:hypothetical protein